MRQFRSLFAGNSSKDIDIILQNRQIIQGRQSIDIPNQTITRQVVHMAWLPAQTSRNSGITAEYLTIECVNYLEK